MTTKDILCNCGAKDADCIICDGWGYVSVTACLACQGTGKEEGEKCPRCQGRGHHE